MARYYSEGCVRRASFQKSVSRRTAVYDAAAGVIDISTLLCV
jgi:hypothetical protein